jgi:hypothetical protein
VATIVVESFESPVARTAAPRLALNFACHLTTGVRLADTRSDALAFVLRVISALVEAVTSPDELPTDARISVTEVNSLTDKGSTALAKAESLLFPLVTDTTFVAELTIALRSPAVIGDEVTPSDPLRIILLRLAALMVEDTAVTELSKPLSLPAEVVPASANKLESALVR